MHRRQFIGAAALVATSPLYASALTNSKWRPVSDRERRALIERAEFQATKKGVSGSEGVAVCTHPLATRAAIGALKAGGNAVDGLCAAALTQTVVEPHMTTVTGVFSMLYHEAASGKSYYINGTNARPLKHPEIDLSRFKPGDAATGDYICVPGYWAGWQGAHDRFGRLPRKRVMSPAVYYAREGFEIHPFLFGEVFVELENIGTNPQGREVFMPDRRLVQPGEKLYQKRYADLLERLAEEGSDYFYHGGFAERFSKIVQASGGSITPEDFARYEAYWDEPARGRYRDFETLASPPPDFGGTDVAQVMQILQHADLEKMGPASQSAETCYLMFKALDEVWSDTLERNHRGQQLSWQERLDPARAARHYEKILKNPPRQAMKSLDLAARLPLDPHALETVTSGSNHLTVIDGEGNVATALHSCMSLPWSNGLFIDGTSICASGVHYTSGMPERGAHFNSRVVPFMVLKNGSPVLACGSPSISLYENLVQNITNILDFGMTIEQSVNLPRFGSNWGRDSRLIEQDMGEQLIAAIAAKEGVKLDVVNPRHWLHGSFEGIHIDGKTAYACGDPHRTAVALAV